MEAAGREEEYSGAPSRAGVEVDDDMVLTDISDDDRADESGNESSETLSKSPLALIFFEHTLSSSAP